MTVTAFLIVLVGGLVAIYLTIFIGLITGREIERRQALAAFEAAWDKGEYFVQMRNMFSEDNAKVSIQFHDGLLKREILTDSMGVPLTTIYWAENDRGGKKPSKREINTIQPLSTQIVTMARLAGDLDLDTPDTGSSYANVAQKFP